MVDCRLILFHSKPGHQGQRFFRLPIPPQFASRCEQSLKKNEKSFNNLFLNTTNEHQFNSQRVAFHTRLFLNSCRIISLCQSPVSTAQGAEWKVHMSLRREGQSLETAVRKAVEGRGAAGEGSGCCACLRACADLSFNLIHFKAAMHQIEHRLRTEWTQTAMWVLFGYEY